MFLDGFFFIYFFLLHVLSVMKYIISGRMLPSPWDFLYLSFFFSFFFFFLGLVGIFHVPSLATCFYFHFISFTVLEISFLQAAEL